MSRLCRLKTKTHGEDGQWAYEEITKLREQVAEQAAVIEFQKKALKTCEKVIDIVWVSHHANRCDDALEYAREALATPTTSTQILAEVRRAERERVIDKCVELGAIERDGVFAEEIRAME